MYFTTDDFSMDKILALMKEDKLREQKILRSQSEMIENTECEICKRKITVRNGVFGITYVLCKHLYAAIKSQSITVTGSIASDMYGVYLQVLDDGPRRW